MTVNTLVLTAGAIGNTTNNITIVNGGTIIRTAGTLASAPIYGATNSSDRVNITYAGTVTTGVETTGSNGAIGTLSVNDGITATLLAGSSLTVDAITVGGGVSGLLTYPNSTTTTSLTVNNGVTINTGGSFTCGTQTSADTHTLTIKGAIANSGTFDMTGSGISNAVNVTLSGSTANQSIGGTGTTKFNSLTLSNTYSTPGATLAGAVTINNLLALGSNKLTVGANTLTFGTTAVAPTLTSGSVDASNSSAAVSFTNTASITLPASFFSGNVNSLTVNGGGLVLGSAITIANNLFLTAGAVTNSTNNITLSNGSTITVKAGTMTAVPNFGTTSTDQVNVIYTNTSGINTGNELPASPSYSYSPKYSDYIR